MSTEQRPYKRRLATVVICNLSLPGDWKARLATQNVRGIADSGAILQQPGVRKETREVIYGADRLAAMHLRGAVEAEVWLYEDLTDDEAERLRLIENIHRRRDNQDHLLDKLVALELRMQEERAAAKAVNAATLVTSETILEEEPADLPSDTELKERSRKTPVGLAREAVAAAAGTTPEAIRQAQKRAKEAAGATSAVVGAPAAPLPPPPSPAVPGLDIAVALDDIGRLLKQALSGITQLAKAHPELTERFPLQQLKWKLSQEVAAGLRACKPVERCAYCKLWPTELANCAACKGSGWLTADQLKDIPKELLVAGEGEGIFVAGEFVTLAELDRRQRGRKVVSKSSRGQERAAAAGEIANTPKCRRCGQLGVGDPGRDHACKIYPPAPSAEDWADAWDDGGEK